MLPARLCRTAPRYIKKPKLYQGGARNSFVPLTVNSTPKPAEEITLYIKGFFANSSEDSHFHNWKSSHLILTEKRGWGKTSYGWHWDSGQLTEASSAPVPWATLMAAGTMAARGLWYGSKALRLTPIGLASGLLVDGGLFVANQYIQATKNADLYSAELAASIYKLSSQHNRPKVRVVAHSLGCKLLLNAIKAVPLQNRPHEVHLCGGAFSESIFKSAYLEGFAKEHTFVYFSTMDTTLQLGYSAFHGGDAAVGYSGLSFPFENVTCVNVDEYFQGNALVHLQYGPNFHKFGGYKPNLELETAKPLTK